MSVYAWREQFVALKVRVPQVSAEIVLSLFSLSKELGTPASEYSSDHLLS